MVLPYHNTINISILFIIFMNYVGTCFFCKSFRLLISLSHGRWCPLSSLLFLYEIVEYVNSYKKEKYFQILNYLCLNSHAAVIFGSKCTLLKFGVSMQRSNV
jgi:hypothetical protein